MFWSTDLHKISDRGVLHVDDDRFEWAPSIDVEDLENLRSIEDVDYFLVFCPQISFPLSCDTRYGRVPLTSIRSAAIGGGGAERIIDRAHFLRNILEAMRSRDGSCDLQLAVTEKSQIWSTHDFDKLDHALRSRQGRVAVFVIYLFYLP